MARASSWSKQRKQAKKAACAVIIALVLQRRRRRHRNRRIWTRKWLLNRERQGAFNQLMQEIRILDTSSYRNFVRMTASTFEYAITRSVRSSVHLCSCELPAISGFSSGIVSQNKRSRGLAAGAEVCVRSIQADTALAHKRAMKPK